MATRPTITTLPGGGKYNASTLNTNFQALRDAFDDLLGRNGSSGSNNTWTGNADAGGYTLRNVVLGDLVTSAALDAQVTAATAQADIATAQVALATAQADIAIAQAVISTTQASTSTAQAVIATTQAGTATTQATNASTSATNAAASAAAAIVAKVEWQGAWSSLTAYALNDAVSYGGSSWICVQANTNQTPADDAYWDTLAIKGNDGVGTVASVAAGDTTIVVAGTATDPTIKRAALTGDVTAASGSNATVIANDAVTYAKMQNISAASRLLGRGSAGGSGDTEEISIGTGLSLSGTTLSATASGTTFKNLLIGGDFTTNPWQRGTSFTAPATGDYSADRFAYALTSAVVVNILKTADAPTTAQAGLYTQHCLHVDVTTADASLAAGDLCAIRQRIEGLNCSHLGFGQTGAQSVTLSFWVKATKTGTYCVAINNSAYDRSYVAEYTVNTTNTWERKTITIAGDTTGTWLNTSGIGMVVQWTIAAGSTFQGTASTWSASNIQATANQVNGMDNTANDFKLALIQLEAGTSATTFESLPEDAVRIRCERYCQPVYGAIGYVFSATNVVVGAHYRTMRATPTFTTVNAAPVFQNSAGTSYTGSSSAVASSTPNAGYTRLNLSGFTGMTTGQFVVYEGSGGVLALASAEL